MRTIETNDQKIEADYDMMHFTLLKEEPFIDKDVYVYGAFNNFNITQENKMTYNVDEKAYTGNFLLKQGFYNYTFATLDSENNVNTNDINGSFYETENEYIVIVYYKPFGSFYERVIGVGTGFFNQNR